MNIPMSNYANPNIYINSQRNNFSIFTFNYLKN